MKKIDIELDNHDRTFKAGEEIRFAVKKLLEALESGSVDITNYDNPWIEAELETDNYKIEVKHK